MNLLKVEIYTSIIISLLSVQLIHSQKPAEKDYSKGDHHVILASKYFNQNMIDSAIYHIAKAGEEYKELEYYSGYITALNNQAFFHDQQKDRLEYGNITKKAFQESQLYLDRKNKSFVQAQEQLGVYYYYIGDFSRALRIMKDVFEKKKTSSKSSTELAKSYINLANNYKYNGDYKFALEHLKKAFSLINNTKDYVLKARLMNNIARIHNLRQNADSTIYYLKLTKELYEYIDSNSPHYQKKINNLIFLAEVQMKNNDLKNVIETTHLVHLLKKDKYNDIKYHETQSRVLELQGKYEESLRYALLADSLSIIHEKANNPPLLARRNLQIGGIYQNLDKPLRAIERFHKGLQHITIDSTMSDIFSLPDVKLLLNKVDALKLLHEKAKSLSILYDLSQDIKYQNTSLDTYLKATELIKLLRTGLYTSESKYDLAEQAMTIYEEAIAKCLELSKKTKGPHYKELAFMLCEANKAQLLLENINEQKAKKIDEIADSLLVKDKDLNIQLAFYNKQLLEKKIAGEKTTAIQEHILMLDQEKVLLNSILEQKYPKYVSLKNDIDAIRLQEIQEKLLDSETAIIGYFAGNKITYTFTITKNDIDIDQIHNPELSTSLITALKSNIENPNSGKKAIQDFEMFKKTSFQLFQMLVQPSIEHLDNSIQNLIIIPDGSINYLPFDVLLQDTIEAQKGYGLNNLNYLITDYTTSYTYSATLLHKLSSSNNTYTGDFIGFAPKFKDSVSSFNPYCELDKLCTLKCAEKEINEINKIVQGQSKIGKEAHKESFEKSVDGKCIIHLATHACIDIDNSNQNKIFLSDDYISNFDLYNYSLNNEMAVLSGCNTGSGQLIKGEGVMSLAKGFFTAGCLSTVISFWQVDDCATSDIMIEFYRELKAEKSKDQALREAKINYITNAKKSKQHPYYWAAFVPYGNMKPIKDQSFLSNPILLSILLFGSIIFAGLFFFNRKKKVGVT